jgi:glutamate-1-semialdehyde 2,1-aminomutase
VAHANEPLFTRWYEEMVVRGVLFHPLQFENLFVSLVHDDRDIDETLEAAADALSVVARTRLAVPRP